ncbi:uncharacterized protein LOC111319151 [Stylophora pistillata]|uniref:uncharacterized protein LOC111319151 n=1 Tax=Stylophora pistillata TaxID=50429 RepID=UPI000C050FF9|nr:uncharacterized protein LOC111319151 [Stylophora pistillata]
MGDQDDPKIVFQTNVYDTKEIGLVLFLFLLMAEDKVSQLKEELGLESESCTGEDKLSEASSSDKGVDLKASSSVADSEKTQVSPASGKLEDLEIESSTDAFKGKDSVNQGKVHLDDELSSGQFGLKESDDGDGKSTEKSEATSVEKELNMKDAPLAGTLQDKITAMQEKLDLDDGPSSDHFASKKESDDDESEPKDYSTSKKESYDDGSKPKGTAKSEGTVSDKGVDFTASSSVTGQTFFDEDVEDGRQSDTSVDATY